MSELETSYRLPREPYLRAVEMLSGLNEFKPEGTSKDRHRLAYPDRFAVDVPDFYATRGNSLDMRNSSVCAPCLSRTQQ